MATIKGNSLVVLVGLLSFCIAVSQQFQIGHRLRRSQAAAANHTSIRQKASRAAAATNHMRLNEQQNHNSSSGHYATSTSRKPTIATQMPRTFNIDNGQQQMMKNVSSRSHLDDISHRLDQPEQNVTQDYDTRVPFWNIAHMINSIEQVDLALSAGSNGIETDVSFDARGFPVEAYHGFPCDCGRHCHHRDDFLKFVRHLARVTTPPATNRLHVVLFDLKLKDVKTQEQKTTAGRALAEIIYKNLYEPYERATNIRSKQALEQNILIQPPLRVILSINHATDLALVKAFIKYMRDNKLDFMNQQVGFDVGMNDKLEEISAAWDSLNGATFNIWQGDGLTNCANIVRGVERLKQALEIRNGQGHFRKVYYWTADVMYHIRSVLRLGIDAVLTNQPQRVNQVLNEDEFKHKFRLATPWDNPFEQFWIRASANKLKPPTFSETVETLANIQKTSENFVKTIPDGITAVVKKVHHSIG